ANAGTGKTSVLIQRLLRILFRTDDLHNCGILCLTYTNAAAGEMRNRILAALREWATAPDDELSNMLDGISINSPATADDLARARAIFFFYIDNPDILKIKTIHGFCEEILRRFPLESGIPPTWTLVSGPLQRTLLNDTFSKLINSANDERVNAAFAHIVGRVSENYLDDILSILCTQYKDFFQITNIDNYRKYFIDTTRKYLNLGTPIQAEIPTEQLQKILDYTTELAKDSKKPAGYLTDIINLTKQYIDKSIDFEKYKLAYINKTDGKKRRYINKYQLLADEQERVYATDQRNIATQMFNDTTAMFDLSAAFAKIYRDIKKSKNLLDFEDLILYTRQLFSNPETMGWVLSQLDSRLTHILVDEAQDTGPLQWDILRMLAGDFFTDGDTSKNPHSLFVVGDTKQSIYGFQGADPNAFVYSRETISKQIRENLRTIQEIPLDQSFRSLPPILKAVDTFFSAPDVISETGFTNNPHKCFRCAPGGLVEIRKIVSKKTDDRDIKNYISEIADKVKEILSGGDFAPHDIMILVQNRAPMAPLMVQELKSRNIPVAGSDRIILPNFPAVRDMLNLVRFCLDNTDDYSLCCVLKSPIFRLTERDIFNICKTKNQSSTRDNPIYIYNILRTIHPDAFDRLEHIVEWGTQLGPYSFFARVLNDNDTRASMIAALGDQIIDPLEEFMTICLSYERTQTGTLRDFIKWFITGGSEIKRDMDASAGVRVVTVHGSKGLESRVVFLIDTVGTPESESILPISTDEKSDYKHDVPPVWLWSPRDDGGLGRATAQAALRRTRIAEYYRLLYVAMTRARDRLYIYGYTPNKNAPENSWHAMLWRVLGNMNFPESDDMTIRITDEN
ncbi:MAG: UvrD-helicase domain-containing protein, partial [Proteobacteria bacterium]|nr:UvrD-helicase domain-containing protein [Candidatus Enterousia avistercoris]